MSTAARHPHDLANERQIRLLKEYFAGLALDTQPQSPAEATSQPAHNEEGDPEAALISSR